VQGAHGAFFGSKRLTSFVSYLLFCQTCRVTQQYPHSRKATCKAILSVACFSFRFLAYGVMPSEEPALRLLSMNLKYGPWKEALIKAWHDDNGVMALRCCGSDLDRERARAARLLRVLRRMCSARHDKGGDDEPWAASVGKNVSHCTGPLAVCLALGVIKKIGGRKPNQKNLKKALKVFRRSCVLRLGVHGSPYRLCSSRERTAAVKRLHSWVVLADRMSVTAAPRTCRQWISAYQRMHEVMHETQPHHIKPHSRWIACVYPENMPTLLSVCVCVYVGGWVDGWVGQWVRAYSDSVSSMPRSIRDKGSLYSNAYVCVEFIFSGCRVERPTCLLGRFGVCCSAGCMWKEFRRCGVAMFLPRTLPLHARIRSIGSRALQAHVSVESAVAPPWRTHCEVSDTQAGLSTLPCMPACTAWSDAQCSGCRTMRKSCKRRGGYSRKSIASSAPRLRLLPGCGARGSRSC